MGGANFETETLANGEIRIHLSGDINNCVYPAIPANVVTLDLDLAKIDRFNSIGIKNWLQFLSQLTKQRAESGRPHKVCISRAPLNYIRMLALLKEMLPKESVVDSFFISFECISCLEVCDIEIKNSRNLDQTIEDLAEKTNCPKCGFATELVLKRSNYTDLAKYAPR